MKQQHGEAGDLWSRSASAWKVLVEVLLEAQCWWLTEVREKI